MKKERKKQLIAVFTLLIFFGSTFAIALNSFFPSDTKQKLIFDEPLVESDEAYFFKQNIVVARVYYDEAYDTIDTLANLINVLNSKMVLERINIYNYPDHYEYIKDNFDTDEMPLVLLRGYTEIYLNGEQTENDLYDDICSLYFEEIDECI